MKRTILSLLIAGAFASIGTPAIAQDTTAANQPAGGSAQVGGSPDTDSTTQPPAKSAKQANPANADVTAQPASKPDYTAAKDKAQTEYKEAKAKCDNQTGESKLSCVTAARATHTAALAQAKTQSDAQGEMNAKDGAKPTSDGMGNSSSQVKNPE
ncbi:MAG: hypothetical protein ACKVQA_17045 [Burkholderiales bacterium]